MNNMAFKQLSEEDENYLRHINEITIEEQKKEREQLGIKFIHHILNSQRGEATEILVRYIEEKNFIKTTRDDEKSEIWRYEKGIYLPNGRSYIEEECRSLMGEAYTTHLKNTVVEKIRADTFIDQDELFNKQNSYPNLIPVENGILNIITKKLEPFTPKIYFFNKLPVTYREGQDCPFFIQFLSDILPSKKEIDTIQELFGFLMLKEYKYEKAFMFLGSGRNGKSKLLDVMKRFLGIENCANLSLQSIEKDRFSICALQNKLVNLSGDISKEGLTNTGMFKNLTGRDLIHADRKFKTMVKFENYAKMIFAANDLPKTKDITEAFFQRWEIIDFPMTFVSEQEYNVRKKENHIRLRNPNIIQEIITQQELSGILNWALEGLERLNRNKYFSCSSLTEEVKDKWIRKSDSVAAFVEDMLIDDHTGFISNFMLKNAYHEYCKTERISIQSDMEFRNTMKDMFVANQTRKTTEDGSFVRGWQGFRFREKNELVQRRL